MGGDGRGREGWRACRCQSLLIWKWWCTGLCLSVFLYYATPLSLKIAINLSSLMLCNWRVCFCFCFVHFLSFFLSSLSSKTDSPSEECFQVGWVCADQSWAGFMWLISFLNVLVCLCSFCGTSSPLGSYATVARREHCVELLLAVNMCNTCNLPIQHKNYAVWKIPSSDWCSWCVLNLFQFWCKLLSTLKKEKALTDKHWWVAAMPVLLQKSYFETLAACLSACTEAFDIHVCIS